LTIRFPDVPDCRHELANCHQELGVLFAQLGLRSEARAEYEKSLEIQLRLHSSFPNFPPNLRLLAGTHHNLGRLYTTHGKLDEARSEYEKARDIQSKLAANAAPFRNTKKT
jgi:Flp pilus assembly protein TadD